MQSRMFCRLQPFPLSILELDGTVGSLLKRAIGGKFMGSCLLSVYASCTAASLI